MTRVAILRALEALESGDQREAADILLAEIEDDRDRLDRVRCDVCGRGFEWPGLLAAHRCSGLGAAA